MTEAEAELVRELASLTAGCTHITARGLVATALKLTPWLPEDRRPEVLEAALELREAGMQADHDAALRAAIAAGEP